MWGCQRGGPQHFAFLQTMKGRLTGIPGEGLLWASSGVLKYESDAKKVDGTSW